MYEIYLALLVFTESINFAFNHSKESPLLIIDLSMFYFILCQLTFHFVDFLLPSSFSSYSVTMYCRWAFLYYFLGQNNPSMPKLVSFILKSHMTGLIIRDCCSDLCCCICVCTCTRMCVCIAMVTIVISFYAVWCLAG